MCIRDRNCEGNRFIQILWCHCYNDDTSVAEIKKSYRTRQTTDETVTFRLMKQSDKTRNNRFRYIGGLDVPEAGTKNLMVTVTFCYQSLGLHLSVF